MQKSKRTGLPKSAKMRHDQHYVDLLASRPSGPIVRMISTNKIDPNPRQARSELGNIKELTASIKLKGLLEPILVRPKGGRYEIIAGERRYIASKNAGLKEIHCIEMDVEDNEAMELALIENLQRKDLNAFEEADGFKSLSSVYGYNHKQISERIGKARSTITEIINISKIPESIRNLCQKYHIMSRTTLFEISKQKNKDDMYRLVQEIFERDLRREDTRDLSKKIKGTRKKVKHFVYSYGGKDENYYKIRIEFKKEVVDKEEIIRILNEVINRLESVK